MMLAKLIGAACILICGGLVVYETVRALSDNQATQKALGRAQNPLKVTPVRRLPDEVQN